MVTMMLRTLPAIGLLALLVCAGCPKESKDEPEEERFKLRAECSKPSAQCWDDCINRDASRYCPSCCQDNTMHCHYRDPYDFEKCKKQP